MIIFPGFLLPGNVFLKKRLDKSKLCIILYLTREIDMKNVEVNLFEHELKKLRDKISNDNYAKDMYGALCNMRWKHPATGSMYSCSWRYAGGLIADMRDKREMYLDYYCSGNEGLVTPQIERDLFELGWVPVPWEEAA